MQAVPNITSQLTSQYATQLESLCSRVSPEPIENAELVLTNLNLAKELGLSEDFLNQDKLFALLFEQQDKRQLNSIAQKYGGHQFGQWNPQLGDGRGLLLGEVKTKRGDLVDLHLKGAGNTPYSRFADGRAVLRSTIREYIASEALHHLGIPSSRALCLIKSQEPVMREQLETAAMMIRTCPSHIRFGHFEYYHHSNQPDKLDALFEFCFQHHFKHLQENASPYRALLAEITTKTAVLIAKWQAFGFNHGVMNTDNMSIHGITFDYGPYAFLDDFIPNYICNKSDHSGRYAFDNQPSIGLWNLNALAHGFSSKLEIEELRQVLSTYEPTFLQAYQNIMHQRLGIFVRQSENSAQLIDRFIKILRDEFADYNLSFYHLSEEFCHIIEGKPDRFKAYFKQQSEIQQWCEDFAKLIQEDMRYAKTMEIEGLQNCSDIQQKLLTINPRYVLRNHHLQNAIEAAQNGDFSVCEGLLKVVTAPFTLNPKWDQFFHPPSELEKGIALSCSS
ncbi:protein adenylyltransferase SelO [Glaciecola sp. 1036]|uniref:protein adenylyltransferase SelO n=1 Tax=Alteromonadaceae TaxID=72275 RepID=UPI003D06FBB7